MNEEIQAGHLSDPQMTESLVGAPGAKVLAHLAQCEACRTELRGLNSSLRQVSEWSRASANRSTGFWYGQRQSIADRLAAQPQHPRLVAWVGALTVLVAAAALLTQTPAGTSVQIQTSAQMRNEARPMRWDQDDALMAEIDASLRRPVPRAFEPALLVTQELHRAAEQNEATP